VELALETWLTNHCPSVLWRCWLGHLTRKIVSKMTYNVSSGTLNATIPYYTISAVRSLRHCGLWCCRNFFTTYLLNVKNVLLLLFQCHIQLDRKVLTDMAIYEPRTFKVRRSHLLFSYYRVTTCLENLEISGNLTAVREMSGILLKVREVSGKKSCQGKVA